MANFEAFRQVISSSMNPLLSYFWREWTIYIILYFVDRHYRIIIGMILYCRLPKIKEYVDKNDPGAMIIPFSGAFEAKLLEMDEDGRKSFCEETKCVGYVCIYRVFKVD